MALAGGIICDGTHARNITPLGAAFPFIGTNILSTLHANMGAPNIDEDETILAMAMVYTINQDPATRAVIVSTAEGAWTIPQGIAFLGRNLEVDASNDTDKGTHGATLAFITRFNEGLARVKTHMTDLVTAQQCKPMSKDNIKSYYASLKIMNIRGTLILRIIAPLALLIERIVGRPNLELTGSPWMSYRMSASSTPALCKKALDIWGTSVPTMFAPPTETAINNALLEPANLDKARAIPKKMVLCAHATLSAFKQLPEDWYYGNTIKESESAMLYKGFYSAAKKLAEVGSNTAAIAAAADLTSLVAAIPSTLKNI